MTYLSPKEDIASDVFSQIESNVRSYCRSFPVLFNEAQGTQIFDRQGKAYLDFLSGAGALNYGHNNPHLKQPLLDYIRADGISHSLDMYTAAKRTFLECFDELILRPRKLDYKVMFPGPTGTNAVEAAMKLSRKVTGRPTIVHCQNGFHGMTLGSLSVTANPKYRQAPGTPVENTAAIPFVCQFDPATPAVDSFLPTLTALEREGRKPAAILLEMVQGEGGINVAAFRWLKALFDYAHAKGILTIVDDIQAGCGRTGTFFSFERAGITPDLVCLSKSISGYGTPMSLVLIRPDLDIWEAGEHNGTFRGNNLAFITGAAALCQYWKTDELMIAVQIKGDVIAQRLEQITIDYPKLKASRRGVGAMQGLVCETGEIAGQISQAAFERGLIIETSGRQGNVVKLLPPLTIEADALGRGLDILEQAVESVLLTAA